MSRHLRILLVNPNSTVSMTDTIAAAARATAAPDTMILAATNQAGPASIQGAADGEAAEPGLLALIREREAEADAFVIACFDDTGLAAARTMTGKPVLGIGEAAFREAAGRGRFSVVTTLSVSVPVIEANIEASSFATACAKVRASEVPVLDLEREGADAEARIAAEISHAIAEDRPDAIVLGCAGMASLAERFTTRFGLPVLDGVVAAVRQIETSWVLKQAGLVTKNNTRIVRE